MTASSIRASLGGLRAVKLATELNGDTHTLTVSGAAIGTPGSASPSSVTVVGGSDGTNARALKVTSAGLLMIDSIPAGSASIGTVVLGAGSAAVGAFTGTTYVTVAPTMGTQTSGAYSTNDFVDALLTLSNIVPTAATGGIIHRVTVLSKSTQTGPYDVIFFNANPTSTTVADNGPVQVNSADLSKVIGVAHCSDVTSFGTGSCHQAVGLSLSFKLPSGTTAYAAVVARFALTQSSTSDMILTVNVIPT